MLRSKYFQLSSNSSFSHFRSGHFHCPRRFYLTYTSEDIALRESIVSSLPFEIYDVVCVGAGPAGLSLTAGLQSNSTTANSLRIALIEARSLKPRNTLPHLLSSTTYSNRCSSVTPSTANFLKDIGIWNELLHNRIQDFQRMHVWDASSNSRIHFNTAYLEPDLGLVKPPLPKNRFLAPQNGVMGYMLENDNLTSTLLDRIRTIPPMSPGHVDIFDQTTLGSITYGPVIPDGLDFSGWPILTLSNGRKIAARLLVGADGINSPVRNFANISTRGWDYHQNGIVATLTTNSPFPCIDPLQLDSHEPPDLSSSITCLPRIAYQRFLPTGPIALLPLPGNRASLVWSITSELAQIIHCLNPTNFVACVNAAFTLPPQEIQSILESSVISEDNFKREIEWRSTYYTQNGDNCAFLPPRITGVQDGSIASFPLRMRHVDTYMGQRCVLIGDAAHIMHPLAGQGLNQGQADVKSLLYTIVDAINYGADIGNSLVLENYCSERYKVNAAFLLTVDAIQKSCGIPDTPFTSIRSLSFNLVDNIIPVKRILMKIAGCT